MVGGRGEDGSRRACSTAQSHQFSALCHPYGRTSADWSALQCVANGSEDGPRAAAFHELFKRAASDSIPDRFRVELSAQGRYDPDLGVDDRIIVDVFASLITAANPSDNAGPVISQRSFV